MPATSLISLIQLPIAVGETKDVSKLIEAFGSCKCKNTHCPNSNLPSVKSDKMMNDARLTYKLIITGKSCNRSAHKWSEVNGIDGSRRFKPDHFVTVST